MTEGNNGKQLSAEEEINEDEYGPCPICALFHDDFCTMDDVMKEIEQ